MVQCQVKDKNIPALADLLFLFVRDDNSFWWIGGGMHSGEVGGKSTRKRSDMAANLSKGITFIAQANVNSYLRSSLQNATRNALRRP